MKILFRRAGNLTKHRPLGLFGGWPGVGTSTVGNEATRFVVSFSGEPDDKSRLDANLRIELDREEAESLYARLRTALDYETVTPVPRSTTRR